MDRVDEWILFTWHCANCGNIVTGYKNARGDIKVECSRCHAVMVRVIKSRRHDTIDLYAPKGEEHVNTGRIYQ